MVSYPHAIKLLHHIENCVHTPMFYTTVRYDGNKAENDPEEAEAQRRYAMKLGIAIWSINCHC